MNTHLWVVGTPDAAADVVVDCHRRLRGPYTGLGTVLRTVVPDVLRRAPDLVRDHLIAILSVAPELTELTGATPETLTSIAAPTERTRIYPANRTRRLAHGAFELLEAYAALSTKDDWTVLFHNVEHADHTDQEFLSIALRRAHKLKIVVATQTEQLTDELATALRTHAQRIDTPRKTYPPDSRSQEELLRAYIDADGTSAHPAELTAYQNADPELRAELHTARATELEQRGEQTLTLGAIPYHHEHGVDPVGAGCAALMAAADYGSSMGFYHAILDYGMRGRALADPDAEIIRPYWLLTTYACTALSMLGRSAESEPIYIELRARYIHPILHMNTGYALGMVYTRFHPVEHRDHHLARSYLNGSIAIADALPESEDRVFNQVFMRNGRALVDMHLRNLPESLRTVDEGIAYLKEKLPAGKHLLHQSVLVHNRGKVQAALGRLDLALADFDTVIDLDPNYPDYYFDRADVRRQLGDVRGALADYDHAITLTAPFYELHYNRADLLVELDDRAGAVAELSYVLELEPDQLDARVNLIGLLLEQGDPAQTRSYVDDGLRLHPGDARLTHASGLLALDNGDRHRAMADFDRALAADPRLIPALVSRATLAHENGDHTGAIADLDAALAIDQDNPDLLYNRGFVHQEAGHWAAAVRDYTRALAQPGADRDELLRHRGRCHAELGDDTARDADLAAAGSSAGMAELTG